MNTTKSEDQDRPPRRPPRKAPRPEGQEPPIDDLLASDPVIWWLLW
jgi:hypothetical protein